MNKKKFLSELRKLLTGLPEAEIEERIEFYSEMIDEKKEEGISEKEAIKSLGSLDEIASQIIIETPIYKIAKEKIKSKVEMRWEIILAIILGSPIWISLLVALLAVVFSVYVSVGAVIISLWAVFVSVLASGFGVAALGFANIFAGNSPEGVAMIGAGIVCVGLSIFVFLGCKAVTKGFSWLTKKIVLTVKNALRKEREA